MDSDYYQNAKKQKLEFIKTYPIENVFKDDKGNVEAYEEAFEFSEKWIDFMSKSKKAFERIKGSKKYIMDDVADIELQNVRPGNSPGKFQANIIRYDGRDDEKTITRDVVRV